VMDDEMVRRSILQPKSEAFEKRQVPGQKRAVWHDVVDREDHAQTTPTGVGDHRHSEQRYANEIHVHEPRSIRSPAGDNGADHRLSYRSSELGSASVCRGK